MINLSHLITHPDFNQKITITRRAGTWVNGEFTVTSITTIPNVPSIVVPATTKDIQRLPEGDAIKGAVNVYTEEPLHPTELNQATGTDGFLSDEITWKGNQWKVMPVDDYSDYGFYKVIAVRKLGA